MVNPVIIVPYDPRWPELFGKLRATLAAALGDLASDIEHVGSTAVQGLAAKPIIDIDVIISSRNVLPCAIERLASIGYSYEGDGGIPGREAFSAPSREIEHHLHVCAIDSTELHRHLTFRNRLRADEAVAKEYAELKFKLANEFRADRAAYTDGKSAWIAKLLEQIVAS